MEITAVFDEKKEKGGYKMCCLEPWTDVWSWVDGAWGDVVHIRAGCGMCEIHFEFIVSNDAALTVHSI